MTARHRGRPACGFTLIELMIVVAILGVVTESLIGDARMTIRQPERLAARVDALADEMALLARLRRDARAAVSPGDRVVMPGGLSLRLGTDEVIYGLDAAGYLVRRGRLESGQAASRRLLPYPLHEFSVSPAYAPGEGPGRAASGFARGVRIRLVGGPSLFASGYSVTLAWREEGE